MPKTLAAVIVDKPDSELIYAQTYYLGERGLLATVGDDHLVEK